MNGIQYTLVDTSHLPEAFGGDSTMTIGEYLPSREPCLLSAHASEDTGGEEGRSTVGLTLHDVAGGEGG